jgi:hypothetical protein
MPKKRMVHNVSAATVARSRVYRTALDNLTRDGATKQGLVDIVMRVLGDDSPTRVTVEHYLKAAVHYGLLDASGNSMRRKYFPPGSIRYARKRNMAEGAHSLTDLLRPLDNAVD